jgi:[protein-PII] uridylyltransferase
MSTIAIPASNEPQQDDLARMVVEGRATIRQFHHDGAFGEQVASALTDLCDRIVTAGYERALARCSIADQEAICRELSVVAVGGYGRSEMAPFSDVDLLFLRSPKSLPVIHVFTAELIRNLWDAGLAVSQSVRTPDECCTFAREEITACTAWTETRLVNGSQSLFDEFVGKIGRVIFRTSPKRFIQETVNERCKEYHDYYSATACLLEPNVKKGAGGIDARRPNQAFREKYPHYEIPGLGNVFGSLMLVVSRPFIFDKRSAPSSFMGLAIRYTLSEPVPEGFKIYE